MTQEEIIKRQREEEDYYLDKTKKLPSSDEEARKRYEIYRCKDPFPVVECALLNSADIFDYVAETGMIYPFEPKNLQGASYEVPIRGNVIWWDEESKEPNQKTLDNPEDIFELKPNSIAFITLEPMFRIPDYLALRFNLKIVHVYKGLLLGTGPLVDPGFVGRLSIPLHNLTANAYTFKVGDGIIQMEFTKLSRNSEWQVSKARTFGLYKRKWMKEGRSLREYIDRSLEGSSNKVVKCSIPTEVTKLQGESIKIKNDVKDFKDDIEKRMKQNQFISIATWVSLATLTLGILTYAGTTIYQLGSVHTIKKEQVIELQKQYEQLTQEYDDTKNDLINRIKELEVQLQKVKEENGVMVDGQEN